MYWSVARTRTVSASASTTTLSIESEGSKATERATAPGRATPLVSMRNWSGAGSRRGQRHQRADEVAAEGAADAAAGDAHQVPGLRFDQVRVDRQLAEIVDQHGKAHALCMAQEVVDQRGLAGAEVAPDNGDGCAPAQGAAGAWNTRPPCTVPQTRTSFRRSAPISSGSSSSTAKSARLPHSMEPTSPSSLNV